ncbi:hypothetical protein LSAT2_001609 [Lamellibrachia satsuma]|nr:hypothetical protein LSAT2_001609 [Lamellibrachia satsuma]
MYELTEAVGQMMALEDLNLTRNFIDPAAGRRLGRSLSSVRRLEWLGLGGCHIDDVSAVDIVTGALKSPGLKVLFLNFNHISPGVEERLKEETGRREGLSVLLDGQESPPVDYVWGRPLPCDSRCVPWTLNQLIKSLDSGDSTSSDDSNVTSRRGASVNSPAIYFEVLRFVSWRRNTLAGLLEL